MVLATAIHLALFMFAPPLTVAEMDRAGTVYPMLEPPPDVELPPRPEPLSRPPLPLIPSLDVAEPATIAPTVPADEPPPGPPPPPARVDVPDDRGRPIPIAIRPELKDPAGARRIVESEYPARLRGAGIDGVVVVWAYIDEEGRVRDARIDRGSGVPALDRAALRAVRRFEYSPAVSRDRRVPVWVRQRIVFHLR